jgi:polyribonucleotide 5'-hydroxyl-kinase
MHIDLDVGQAHIGIPGTIGCNVIERPCDIETGFSDLAPLCFHYGDKSIDSNINLYKLLIEQLAEVVFKKQDEDQLVKESGMIINTGNLVFGLFYNVKINQLLLF